MLFLLLIPSAQAAASGPAARWGHQAVYIASSNSMYVVGGASTNSVSEVTNDVYILSLGDDATWSPGPNASLPAHAFASMVTDQETLIVAGGMTSSCSSDATLHTLDIGAKSWSSDSPTGFVRRHGAGAAMTDDGVMVVGGLVDKYVCSSGTSGYAAYDLLEQPGAAPTSKALPLALTGGVRAVSDFGLAFKDDKVFLAGGQAADGTLIPFDAVATWTKADGWVTHYTNGNIPAGRLGASLVAHPTLDALVLFGGSTKVSSDSFSASGLVALLNTTTWSWSIPSNLQPMDGSEVSYHSAVMTPQGVMITAFGRNRIGYPTNSVSYLDMRDPTGANWGWSSTWSKDLLNKYTGTPIAPTTDLPNATDKAAAAGGGKSNKGTIAAAVVPTVILLLILIPLAVWFIRRQIRNRRQARLASHFSFSTQEDRGDFVNRVDSRYAAFGSSFGSQGSLNSLSKRVMSVFRRGTKGVGDDGTIHEAQMAQVIPPAQLQRANNWEEIDFGLGRIDAERREGNYTDLPARLTPRPGRSGTATPVEGLPFPMPIASTMRYVPEPEPEAEAEAAENPFSDAKHDPFNDNKQASPVLGDLVRFDTDSPRLGSPRTDGQVPLVQPHSGDVLSSAGSDASAVEINDWNMLEQAMMARPVFKSPSPNSTLRTQAHARSASLVNTAVPATSPTAHMTSRVPVPPLSPALSTSSVASSAPSLPPMQFSHTPLTTPQRVVSGGASQSRHLAGSGSPRRMSRSSHTQSASISSSSGTRPRRDSVNALGLTRGASRLRVTNPSDSVDALDKLDTQY